MSFSFGGEAASGGSGGFSCGAPATTTAAAPTVGGFFFGAAAQSSGGFGFGAPANTIAPVSTAAPAFGAPVGTAAPAFSFDGAAAATTAATAAGFGGLGGTATTAAQPAFGASAATTEQPIFADWKHNIMRRYFGVQPAMDGAGQHGNLSMSPPSTSGMGEIDKKEATVKQSYDPSMKASEGATPSQRKELRAKERIEIEDKTVRDSAMGPLGRPTIGSQPEGTISSRPGSVNSALLLLAAHLGRGGGLAGEKEETDTTKDTLVGADSDEDRPMAVTLSQEVGNGSVRGRRWRRNGMTRAEREERIAISQAIEEEMRRGMAREAEGRVREAERQRKRELREATSLYANLSYRATGVLFGMLIMCYFFLKTISFFKVVSPGNGWPHSLKPSTALWSRRWERQCPTKRRRWWSGRGVSSKIQLAQAT